MATAPFCSCAASVGFCRSAGSVKCLPCARALSATRPRSARRPSERGTHFDPQTLGIGDAREDGEAAVGGGRNDGRVVRRGERTGSSSETAIQRLEVIKAPEREGEEERDERTG